MTTTTTGPPPPPEAPPTLDSPLAEDTGFLPGETGDTLGEDVVSVLDSGATQLASAPFLSGLSGGSADFSWAEASGGLGGDSDGTLTAQNDTASPGSLADFTGTSTGTGPTSTSSYDASQASAPASGAPSSSLLSRTDLLAYDPPANSGVASDVVAPIYTDPATQAALAAEDAKAIAQFMSALGGQNAPATAEQTTYSWGGVGYDAQGNAYNVFTSSAGDTTLVPYNGGPNLMSFAPLDITPAQTPTPPTPPPQTTETPTLPSATPQPPDPNTTTLQIPTPQPPTVQASPPAPLSQPPGSPPPAPQPGSDTVPFDPHADSPFANWLLYGNNTPFLDFLTNDANLRTAQNVALGVAIGAGVLATGGMLAQAAPAIGNAIFEGSIQIAARAPTATSIATSLGNALTYTTVPRVAVAAGGTVLAAEAAEELPTLGQQLGHLGEQLADTLGSDEPSFAGVINPSEFENEPAIIDRLTRARQFDIGGYDQLKALGPGAASDRVGRLGDNLDVDEALQNAYLRLVKDVGRVSDVSKNNPSIALSPQLHRLIQNLQTGQMQGLTPNQVLQFHLQQMRNLGIAPDYVIQTLERESQQFIARTF
jgi:hypothetical protein